MGPRKRRKVEEGAAQLHYSIPIPKSSIDTSVRASTSISKDELVSLLKDAMKDKLSDLVLDFIKTNKPKTELAQLKSKLSNASSVPHGTYTPTDTQFQQSGKTTAYIRQFNIIPLIIWKEVIDEDFDVIAESKKNEVQECDNEDMTLMRAFVTPFQRLFRDDLPQHIREVLIDSIKQLQNEISDYVLQFSTVVETMMLLYMQSGTNSNTNFVDILPEEFMDESFLHKPIIPMPNKEENDKKNDADWLFTEFHLQYIHSCNFSTSKPRSDMKEKHPIWYSLQEKLGQETSIINIITTANVLSVSKYNALDKFSTNLKNMWSNKMLNKSLDYIIKIMLTVHLRPKFERNRRDVKRQLQQQQQQQDLVPQQLKPFTRNHKRSLIRFYARKLQKYDKINQTASIQQRVQKIGAKLKQIKKTKCQMKLKKKKKQVVLQFKVRIIRTFKDNAKSTEL
jgi:hypothetical protein